MKPNNAMKLLGVVGVTTATAFMGMGEARAIVIVDTFDNGQTTLFGNNNQFTDNPNEILQEQRDIQTTSSGSGQVQTGATQGNDEILQVFSFDIGNADTVTLNYDGIDGSTGLDTSGLGTTGNGIDFDESGTNQGLKFRLFNPTDQSDLDVTLYSKGGSESVNASINLLPSNIDSGNSENLFIGFNSGGDTQFSTNNNFDFADISAVQIELTTLNNPVGIEAFGAVPDRDTPIDVAAVPFEAETSAALVLLGGWGAWKYWKRRKQQQINFDDTEA
jgi:hypothetical protein